MNCAGMTLLMGIIAGTATAYDVALDVGHYSAMPGVVGASGVKEFAYNRLLALEVAKILRKNGISYQLIGEDGRMSVLAKRTEAARYDRLFLSFHHDSVLPEWFSRVEQFSGYSLFVSRKNLKIDYSLSCARIIGGLLKHAGFHPSRYHATPVKGENRPFADESLGVHYYDDLIVLKTARQPAVLIEAGVIVNPADVREVTGNEGRHRVAKAVADGVDRCLPLISSD